MAHRSTEPTSILVEDDALRLPSQMPLQTTTLADYEWWLRYGQAFDSLAELCQHLLMLSSMYQSKDQYWQGSITNVIVVLGKSDWQSTLRPLLNSDIRGLKDGEDASSSEGCQTLSWIWMAQRMNDAEMTEGMNEGEHTSDPDIYVSDDVEACGQIYADRGGGCVPDREMKAMLRGHAVVSNHTTKTDSYRCHLEVALTVLKLLKASCKALDDHGTVGIPPVVTKGDSKHNQGKCNVAKNKSSQLVCQSLSANIHCRKTIAGTTSQEIELTGSVAMIVSPSRPQLSSSLQQLGKNGRRGPRWRESDYLVQIVELQGGIASGLVAQMHESQICD
ncbi:hypothetical protein IMY05_C4836000100 [Salix suchowensis]|nr:hypothetical protein IMY05_C4836000100 [Salix suchowensis]